MPAPTAEVYPLTPSADQTLAGNGGLVQTLLARLDEAEEKPLGARVEPGRAELGRRPAAGGAAGRLGSRRAGQRRACGAEVPLRAVS